MLGRKQFGDQFIGQAELFLHRLRLIWGRREVSLQPGCRNEREPGVDEIAMHDVPAWIRGTPSRKEALGHLTQDGLLSARTGLNNEKLGHWKFLFGLSKRYAGCRWMGSKRFSGQHASREQAEPVKGI